MKHSAHFAIIGCGMAGLASALFLLRAGHRVTLFERFHTPQAVGAGILLQPTGIAVLRRLELLQSVMARGAVIHGLHGLNQHGRRIMDIHYRDLNPAFYGLGIHRGSLFSCLYEAAVLAGATIHCNHDIQSINRERDRSIISDANGQHHGPFDAVIIANGTQSALRRQLPIPHNHRPYPWGALWTILPDPQQQFTTTLQQRYAGAHTMVGILPSGSDPYSGQPCVSFFWSLPLTAYPNWRQENTALDRWKQRITELWPALDQLLTPLSHPDDLTLASYGDVVMRHWHDDHRLCIGDAAHGMSPQLGQGTNLALIDALVLAESLNQNNTIAQAFVAYSRQRRAHLRFYQFASRWLTPLFQSHSRIGALWRDLSFPIMQHFPLSYREALRTVAGVKTGWLLDRDIDI